LLFGATGRSSRRELKDLRRDEGDEILHGGARVVE